MFMKVYQNISIYFKFQSVSKLGFTESNISSQGQLQKTFLPLLLLRPHLSSIDHSSHIYQLIKLSYTFGHLLTANTDRHLSWGKSQHSLSFSVGICLHLPHRHTFGTSVIICGTCWGNQDEGSLSANFLIYLCNCPLTFHQHSTVICKQNNHFDFKAAKKYDSEKWVLSCNSQNHTFTLTI